MPHSDEKDFILAVDQGTTSSKALVLHRDGRVVGQSANFPIDHRSPREGFCEFDPEQMLESVQLALQDALRSAGVTPERVSGIGLANQGETVIAFDRDTGRVACPAVSWQDKRGDSISAGWRALDTEITARTGLRNDSYFSAPKIRWLLDHEPEVRRLASSGRLALGTSDAWLVRRLTEERAFVTDFATASRTMAFNLAEERWDDFLLDRYGIPAAVLPAIVANDARVGTIRLGSSLVPLTGLCVDQHAALFGHGCTSRGTAKITYGTGCFVLGSLGTDHRTRIPGLLTALGWKTRREGACHIVEGSIFSAASIVNWLVEIGVLRSADEIDALLGSETGAGAGSVAGAPPDAGPGVRLVPAFAGLGAPHWNSKIAASWHGLRLGTSRAELVRSALESIAFQVRDVVSACEEAGFSPRELKIDGGLSRSTALLRLQAEVLGRELLVSDNPDITAMGVGYLAGLGSGLWSEIGALPLNRRDYRSVGASGPADETTATRYRAWRRTVDHAIRGME